MNIDTLVSVVVVIVCAPALLAAACARAVMTWRGCASEEVA